MNKKEQEAADALLDLLKQVAGAKAECNYSSLIADAYATLVGAAQTRDQLEQDIAYRQPPEPAMEKPKAAYSPVIGSRIQATPLMTDIG